MPTLTRPRPLSTEHLDTFVTALSQDVEAGLKDEAAARMEIFEAVFRSGIVERATLEWCDGARIPMFMRDDMVAVATDFYTERILACAPPAADSDEPVKQFFSISLFAQGHSAAGSIRQALRNETLMKWTLLRKVRRIHRNTTGAVSLDVAEGPQSVVASRILAVDDNATAHLDAIGGDDRGEALLCTHAKVAAGKRGVARTSIDAATVRAMYSLPELERPLDPRRREALLGLLVASPKLAVDALRTRLAGETFPDEATRAVADLFRPFSTFDLETLSEVPHAAQVADLLAREAVADRARPNSHALSRLRRMVKQELVGLGLPATWGPLLADAFIENEFEARSAWVVDTDALPERRHGAETFLAMLNDAAALDGAPLGRSARAVRTRLEELVGQARQSSTRSRNSTAEIAATAELADAA